MNNKSKLKSFLMAFGMAVALFVYGYAASQLGHDHSRHEHHEEADHAH